MTKCIHFEKSDQDSVLAVNKMGSNSILIQNTKNIWKYLIFKQKLNWIIEKKMLCSEVSSFWLDSKRIKHIRSTNYYPSRNKETERNHLGWLRRSVCQVEPELQAPK